MVQVWLIELLKGTGKLFLQPLFYYLFILAAILGVSRVKRERRNFIIRVEDAYFELRQLLPLGLLIGLCISIITIGLGIVIPVAAIILISVATFVWSFTTKIRFLAPVYTIGPVFFALIFLANKDLSIPVFKDAFSSIHQQVYPSLVVLLALLLIAEGTLIIRNGSKGTSPKLMKSKRGQIVGVHEVKRLWMLPVFLFIPGKALVSSFDWWPVFTIGTSTYSIILVPFAIGFHQKIQGLLPKEAVKSVGKKVLTLGLLSACLAAVGYWMPLVSIGVVALALVVREFITIRQHSFEERLPFYFSKRNKGLQILGVLPDSPAEKMDLQVGELITKVNGVPVNEETAFYEALQYNRAHCKLEVLDVNGEIRFVQRALYEGDHHELGILFVQDEKKWSVSG